MLHSSLIKKLVGHPLNQRQKIQTLSKFISWNIGMKLVSEPIVHEWIGGAKFIARKNEFCLAWNVHCGLLEFNDMSFLLHALSSDDLFVDVGANGGSYTLLASKVKGAKTICFEPVPDTHERLLANIRLNGIGDHVTPLNIGLSDAEGELSFTANPELTGKNHVLTDSEPSEHTVRVRVKTMDSALENKSPAMLKIDVEGFEAPVLHGAQKILSCPSLLSVIIELNESGARYGVKDDDIVRTLQDHGFSTYAYEPIHRKLEELNGKNRSAGNTIFIRDLEAVKSRIARAPKFEINGIEI